jgi:hypothetical protein
MRSRWVLVRWIGLLAALVLALLLGQRLAGADEPQLDARPRKTGQSALAPAGTTFGSETPLRNVTPPQADPPQSPTPPGFPFGPRGGSWAPAGPGQSGAPYPTGFTPHR